MKFISKKEFDDAVGIINTALKNEQILDGHGGYPLSNLLFKSDGNIYDTYSLSQVSFIAADLAIKDRLFKLRKELYKQKESTEKNKKELEVLEKEEQQLATLLSTSKE